MPFYWRKANFGEVCFGVVRQLLDVGFPYSYFGSYLFRDFEGEIFLGCRSGWETYALG